MAWYTGGLRGYWRRTSYRRLVGEDGSGRKVRNKIELGGGRRRRFWRIRVSPRLRILRVISPIRILSRIRDAYVRMMLSFASSGVLGSYGSDGMDAFYVPPMKEYDERMILELYKSIISQGQLIPARKLGAISSSELAIRT